ncbi:MAG: hypothetical protein AB7F28_05460 [Candidatus Margulisiibacteriota bacterium]
MNDDLKKQWQADAEQLKADLDNRPKVVQKREVPIQFGGKVGEKAKPEIPSKPAKKILTDFRSDLFLRETLRITPIPPTDDSLL